MTSGHLFGLSRATNPSHLNSGRMTTTNICRRSPKQRTLAANFVPSLGKPFTPLLVYGLMVVRFRNNAGQKEWKVFSIAKSSTTPIRTHFQTVHPNEWSSACADLSIPQKSVKEQAPAPDVEPFTRDGFMLRLIRFVTVDDQVCLQPSRFLAPLPTRSPSRYT